VRTDVRVGRLGGFFHDVAELTSESDFALTGHRGHFDKKNVTANGGVGQTGDQTNLIRLFGESVIVDNHTQIFIDLFLVNLDGKFFARSFGFGYFTHKRSNLALEITDTGLTSIVTDDVFKNSGRKNKILQINSIGIGLFLNKIFFSNRILFFSV